MAARFHPKVDVHAHFLPPSYREACLANGHQYPDGMPYLPEWSEDAHLKLMENLNITKSFLSISTPGTHLSFSDRELAIKLTRDTNAYAADLKRRKPEKFGYFAFLPIPEVDVCIEEIKRCSEEGCDGFALLTNGHGHYLGDTEFDPIFEELNRRKATVFIHPTTPCLKCSLKSLDSEVTHATPLSSKYPNPMLEFFFDTTRAITNLFLSGTIERCPDIKIIIPGLGGATPSLLSRWTGFSTVVKTPSMHPCTEENVVAAFNRQFWFDVGGIPFPSQVVGMTEGVGVGPSRLLFGTDFPFASSKAAEMLAQMLNKGMAERFTDDEVRDIYSRNAEHLLG